MQIPTAAFVTAGLLLLSLALYAIYLALQVRQQRQQRQAAEQALADELAKKEREARQSLQIIARTLIQKDLSETEAAMRISWLAQQIQMYADEAQHLSVFKQLAEATSHIPILDDWAALSKAEKRRLNLEREAIEVNYRDFIQVSAEQLVSIRLL